MEYQQGRDEVSDAQWQAELDRYLANDTQAQKNYENEFAYQKEQDALAQKNYQEQFDYQKEQNQQAQSNWQAEFDREGEWYDDAQEANNPNTTYNDPNSDLNGQSVPKQIAGVPGLTTTNVGLFDENGYFKQAAVVSGTYEEGESGTPEVGKGTMTYNIGGKEVTLKTGTSPYTNTVNPDANNGVMANGYQPDNIGGNKVEEIGGQTALVNGQNVPVYTTKDKDGNIIKGDDSKARMFAYDAANNEYFEVDGAELEEETDNVTPNYSLPFNNSHGKDPQWEEWLKMAFK